MSTTIPASTCTECGNETTHGVVTNLDLTDKGAPGITAVFHMGDRRIRIHYTPKPELMKTYTPPKIMDTIWLCLKCQRGGGI